MSKRALGRGLESLLPRKPAPDGDTPPSPTPEPTPFGRGFETLLSGSRGDLSVAEPPYELCRGALSQAKQLGRQVDWWRSAILFVLTDAILLGVAAWLVFASEPNVTWGRIACAGVLVVLACWAGLMPWLRSISRTGAVLTADAECDWVVVSSDGAEFTRRYLIHLTRPVFVGEVVSGEGREDKVVPLWIEQGVESPAQAVEQLITRLRELPRKSALPSAGQRGALRHVLTRM